MIFKKTIFILIISNIMTACASTLVGPGVDYLNGIDGDVALKAGSNVNIETNFGNNSIVISSIGTVSNAVLSLNNLNGHIQLANTGNLSIITSNNSLYFQAIVPTNISELQNDSGFITKAWVTNNQYAIKSWVETNAILEETDWHLPDWVKGMTNIPSYTYSEVIGAPTNVSYFINNIGYLIQSEITNAIKSFIPTNISQYNNDANYVTSNETVAIVGQELPETVSYFNNDLHYLTETEINEIVLDEVPKNLSNYNNDIPYATIESIGLITSNLIYYMVTNGGIFRDDIEYRLVVEPVNQQ